MGVKLQVVRTEPSGIGPIGQSRQNPVSGGVRVCAKMDFVTLLDAGHKVHRRFAEQAGGDGISGLAVDLRGWAELGDPPLPHRGGVPAQQQRLFGFGGGINKNCARFFKDARDFGAQLLTQFIIKVGQGFIQQDQPRAFHQSPRQGAALLLSA